VKKEFWYKDKTYQRLVTIKEYEEFGVSNTFNTLIIEFQDGHLSCIYPDYLKDMPSPNFGKEIRVNREEAEELPAASTRPTERSKAESTKKVVSHTTSQPSASKPKKAAELSTIELLLESGCM
jgi:hypothetical protein